MGRRERRRCGRRCSPGESSLDSLLCDTRQGESVTCLLACLRASILPFPSWLCCAVLCCARWGIRRLTRGTPQAGEGRHHHARKRSQRRWW